MKNIKKLFGGKFFKKNFCTAVDVLKNKVGFKFRPLVHTPMLLLATGATMFGYTLYDDTSFRKGLMRSSQFWMRTFPIYMRYRITEWKVRNESPEDKKKEFKKLHEVYAPEALQLVHDLRGFYVKMGQVMSTRSDFAPEEYMKVMSTLQDKAPHTDFTVVKKVIEDSLGRPLEEIFSHFDEVPLGSASIGQVHAAVLRETGEKVVIKVQYPDVENLFKYDFATTRTFTKIAQPESLPMMDELEKQFMTEFDFEREARSIETIRKNMHAYYSDIVKVPKVYSKYTTKKTIVMEFLDGVKLLDSLKQQYEKIAQQMGLTLEELRDIKMKEALDKKPKKMSKIQMEAFRFFLWLKKSVYNSFVFLYNNTFGNFTFKMEYSQIEIPINHITMMETLLKVHGHQILIDGMFNGDPHPGNFLLLKNSPKIGLIDFGQTKIMSIQERVNLAKLIIAIADRNKEETINVFKMMGFKSKNMDPFVVENTAVFFYDRDGELMGDKNIQQYLEYLNSLDKTVAFPDQYLMAGRVSFLLRGLGTHLQYPLEVCKIWRPYAEKVLEMYDKKEEKHSK